MNAKARLGLLRRLQPNDQHLLHTAADAGTRTELITLTARDRPEPPKAAIPTSKWLAEGAFCALAHWLTDSARRCDLRKCTDLTKVEIRSISGGDSSHGRNSPGLTRYYATGQHPTN